MIEAPGAVMVELKLSHRTNAARWKGGIMRRERRIKMKEAPLTGNLLRI